jgi:hypothetical protein
MSAVREGSEGGGAGVDPASAERLLHSASDSTAIR